MLSRGTLGDGGLGPCAPQWSSPRLNVSSCTLIRTISNIRADWGMRENKPEEKDLGLLVDKKWDVDQQCVCLPSTKPTVSRSVSKEVLPTGQERRLFPFVLLWWHSIRSNFSSAGVPSARAGPEEGHRDRQNAGTSHLSGKAERIGAFQPGEQKAPGGPYISRGSSLQPFST